jgi:hypothetical protein
LNEEIGRSKGVKNRARMMSKLLKQARVVELRVALEEVDEALNKPGDLDAKDNLRAAQAENRAKVAQRIFGEEDVRVRELLTEFGHLFGTPRADPPSHRPAFGIDTLPGTKAPWKNPYRSRRLEDEEMARQLRVALRNRCIDPSS